MILYHGTSLENKEKILENGFKTTYGEYGECVYFAVNKDLAYDYGDEIIAVFIDKEYIVEFDEVEIDAKCSRNELENIASTNGYKAVKVNYSQCTSSRNESEVCIYDTSVIEIN